MRKQLFLAIVQRLTEQVPAVKFIDLTREQQLDVIARTCHDRM